MAERDRVVSRGRPVGFLDDVAFPVEAVRAVMMTALRAAHEADLRVLDAVAMVQVATLAIAIAADPGITDAQLDEYFLSHSDAVRRMLRAAARVAAKEIEVTLARVH